MKKTVLVVEDESLSRTIIVHTLKSFGLHCIEAENGQEAIEKLEELKEEERCDLILTDLNMPIKNGIELIDDIRKGNKVPSVSPEIPIIVLSAEEGQMVEDAKALGISASFIKKEPVDRLVPTLKQLLGLTD